MRTNRISASTLAFLDEQKGFLVLPRNNKHLMTLDGGQTWRGVISKADGPVRFAREKVGWSVTEKTVAYTVDGGRRWLASEAPLPAYANDFSLGSCGRVYVVGDHGMVFRYTVVLETYEAPNMIEAPVMGCAENP